MPGTTAEKPIRHASLSDQVVERVFRAIADEELALGSRITEDELAVRFGVSRTPVREAVKQLAEMGLLVVRPRCGLEIVRVDASDLLEITELRENLETFAMRLAMERVSAEDIGTLEAITERCEALLEQGGRLDVFREDGRFHLAIAALSGNRYLAEALRRLEMKVQLCRALFCRSDSKVEASVRFHRKIIAAMKKGAAKKAEELLREHIKRTVKEKS